MTPLHTSKYSLNVALETCLETQTGFELQTGNHSSLREYSTELGGFSVGSSFYYEYSWKTQVNIY